MHSSLTTAFTAPAALAISKFNGAQSYTERPVLVFRPRALPSAPVMRAQKDLAGRSFDTVIIGSGIVGSTAAKYLVDGGTILDGDGNKTQMAGGQNVLMIDAGQKMSEETGAHIKNSIMYQSDHGEGRRLFAQLIAGTMEPISRTPKPAASSNAFPTTWQPGVNNDPESEHPDFSPNLTNPDQQAYFNVPGATISYKVGGMSSHWTCSIPRPHNTLERNSLFPNDALYTIAEDLLHLDQDAYKNEVRDALVHDVLSNVERLQVDDPDKRPRSLPLAVNRINEQYVDWTGPSVVLGDLAFGENPAEGSLTVADQLICTGLNHDASGHVTSATLYDPRGKYNPDGKEPWSFEVYADTFIGSCGQVHTAQLLAKSGFQLPAIGRYLTEQPFFFTRIILNADIVDRLKNLGDSSSEPDDLKRFSGVIAEWSSANPDDPVPIPRKGSGSGEAQQWVPLSENREWHVQIHQDNFFGQNENTDVDDRLVVGIRYFVKPEQLMENRVTFDTSETGKVDLMGMPQPTFDYSYRRMTKARVAEAYEDMLHVMSYLGAPVPQGNSEIQFLENGSALHIHGCNRIGNDMATSVADQNGLVWGTDNLYVAGNGTIPSGLACNPTLTSVCLAIRSVMNIRGRDTSKTFHEV